ncbi:hypothetical protein CEXT_273631 [Caerostris extrusa]|uniref:Uncharacterized protein n=1 Tax=Caerostris extrusa TaxID=172846 RepID=A0AAV4RVC7_CAEEX|nr:hypothetical protein CEXT_273631 [Caerostris extrusa]
MHFFFLLANEADVFFFLRGSFWPSAFAFLRQVGRHSISKQILREQRRTRASLWQPNDPSTFLPEDTLRLASANIAGWIGFLLPQQNLFEPKRIKMDPTVAVVLKLLPLHLLLAKENSFH